MGAPFVLTFFAIDQKTADRAQELAFSRVKELDTMLSDYKHNSELNRLSRTAGQNQWVKVSDELFEVLWRSQEISKQSEGAFDVTVGPYVVLWRMARFQKKLPKPHKLKALNLSVGHHLVSLKPQNSQVKLGASYMRLDLGGIAKGYAADEALKVLKLNGIEHAMVDAGGDLVGSSHAHEPHWSVAVDYGKVWNGGRVIFKEGAIATSGDTGQFVEIEGKHYSHIVNPQSGIGLTDRVQVTVIADQGALADAWASALSVMGLEKGLKKVESLKGVEALFVQVKNQKKVIVKSSGFPNIVG